MTDPSEFDWPTVVLFNKASQPDPHKPTGDAAEALIQRIYEVCRESGQPVELASLCLLAAAIPVEHALGFSFEETVARLIHMRAGFGPMLDVEPVDEGV